jgi:hypothetical protein
MPRTPAAIARRLGQHLQRADEAQAAPDAPILVHRETFRLPRAQAGATARAFLERYPESAYRTRIESWRLLDNGLVEFTMRRLPQVG